MAAGNPTPFAAASMTKYRTTSLGPGQARLDRQTSIIEYMHAASPMHNCAVCAKGTDLSSHDQLLVQFHQNMEQTPGAGPNAVFRHSLKCTLSRRTAVFNCDHSLSTNCYQFMDPDR